MNDAQLRDAARAATDRRGLLRLLALLGFTGPFAPAPRYPLPFRVRAMESTRGALLVTVIELRRRADVYACRQIAHALRSTRPASHHFIAVRDAESGRIEFVIDGGAATFQRASLDPAQLRMCDVDLLREMIAPVADNGTAVALRLERALDRRRVSERFFRDISACRAQLASAWKGIPANATQDRESLALLLLSRLMFLYFLQQQELLAGDTMFISKLLRPRHQRSRTLFRAELRTLFFGVLNRRPERRTASARALGALPYLNGGLFEEHALERRRPDLDLPDAALLRAVTDVLEKYRFTTRDLDVDGSHAVIEPEMLGRIFEGLMPGERRQRTGSFYTPPELVDRVTRRTLTMHVAEHCAVPVALVQSALDKASVPDDARARVLACCNRLAVLDPACGSGSFLLGALDTIVALRRSCGDDSTPLEDTRRAVVAQSLHGVDLLGDAALICSLRLWLALVPRCERVADVPPLPNLDRHIRQGDALVEPFDLTKHTHTQELPHAHRRRMHDITSRLAPLAEQYMSAGPDTKARLRRDLQRYEMQLARSWTDALETQLQRQARELHARAGDRDLFGEAAAHAVTAALQLELNRRQQAQLQALLEDLRQSANLPFFSFRVHFPHVTHGFDTILMNPPWVRSHHWPAAARDLLRERYEVCARAGWPYAARATGATAGASAQVDLSLLFLERAVRLLAQRGTLGAILPAKLFRSLYAGGARALLLEDMQLRAIEDHSLDHRDVFTADAFPAVVIAHRSGPDGTRNDAVDVRLGRRSTEPLCFNVPVAELPLRHGDTQSPWLLAPPECAAALRRMQQAGPPVVEHALTIRRGVMSAANDVLVLASVEPKLGGLLSVRSEGYGRAVQSDRRRYRAIIEDSCVRPCLRGTDVRAWHCDVQRHVVWSPHNDDRKAPLPRGLQRYLRQNFELLHSRRAADGMLRRLSPQLGQHKVVWADVATSLRACALPATARTSWGREAATIPLNTVYFIATPTVERAQLLAAYLNALPCRVFTRTIAERAKDAHFRFFAWTVGMLPLPRNWEHNEYAAELIAIARRAHEASGIDAAAQNRLDALVAQAFGLCASDIDALRHFDRWLEGS